MLCIQTTSNQRLVNHSTETTDNFSAASYIQTTALLKHITITGPPKVIWEEPYRHPSRQKMNLPAARASCAMPTADESNHSAVGMTHPPSPGKSSLCISIFVPTSKKVLSQLSGSSLSMVHVHEFLDTNTYSINISQHC